MEDSNNKKVARSDHNKIDALPDSILYNILSFLDMKEVISTSFVSRRWRYLWESVPVLNFVHKECRAEDDEVSRNRFMNFVDRVLLLRNSSMVNIFKIVGACDDSDRLLTWLAVAARKQFQEVHLYMYANEQIKLPDIIFLSAITVFNLVVDRSSPMEYPAKFPGSFSSSPQLKTLILDYVVLPESNSNGELMFSCPVLENLTLKYCDQSNLSALIISTPQLKSLLIINVDDVDIDCCHTKLWTPNLVSLEWTCLWEGCCSFGNLSNLVNAKIACFGGGEPDADNLVKVLDAVCCATTIELSLEIPKDMLNKLMCQFSNLRRLTLHQWGKNLYTCLVFKLLKNAPSIETLVLNGRGMEDFDEELSQFMLCHLKSVEVEVLEGCQNGVKFLKVLLKISTALEELIIKMHESSITEKVTFGKKIRSLTSASPSLAVIVV